MDIYVQGVVNGWLIVFPVGGGESMSGTIIVDRIHYISLYLMISSYSSSSSSVFIDI